MGKSFDSIQTQSEDYTPPIYLEKGEYILICIKCNWRLAKNTVCSPFCPNCDSRLQIVERCTD